MNSVTDNTQPPEHSRRARKLQRRSDRGAGVVEYGMTLALVAMLAAAGTGPIGDSIATQIDSVAVAIGGPCTNFDARWEAHLAIREEHRDEGTWKGKDNKPTRQEWKAIRDELKALGC